MMAEAIPLTKNLHTGAQAQVADLLALLIGFNVEKAQYKNVAYCVWDVDRQENLGPLWKMHLSNSDALRQQSGSQCRAANSNP
nr:uncharacterized protein LOC127295436 isoform X3 [Lolium perenne]